MLNSLLARLVEEKLTSVREIAELTGRGESTVYRWLSRQSQPDFDDIRLLVRHLNSTEAQQRLIELFASGLPIVIEWKDEQRPAEEQTDVFDALDFSLLALETFTDALARQRAIMRQSEQIEQGITESVALIDKTIQRLTTAKNILVDQAPRRRRARPPQTG